MPRLPVLLATLAALSGCASRRVPAAFPRSSAASEQASEAPPAEVTATFADEPSQPAAPALAPDHHGGHHGH